MSKRHRMAVEAAAMASLIQKNRDVCISKPSMNNQAALETSEVMNCQNSNAKDKSKGKCTANDKEAADIALLPQQNRRVGISEPPMDSLAALDSDEGINSQNSNLKGSNKGKGKCNGKRKDNNNGPKPVLFNRMGQPVGPYAAPLAHFLSKTAKSLVPLTVRSWFGNGLSAQHKDLIWNHVKKYYIIEDRHRKFCFQKMAKYWRNYRTDMIKAFKQGVKSASVEVVAKNTRPANVHSLELWIQFIKYSLAPTQAARRKRYQELRLGQDLQYHGGKKSLACIGYDMEEESKNPENPDEMIREVTRTDVWLAGFSRKKRDGDEEIEDQEIVEKFRKRLPSNRIHHNGLLMMIRLLKF